MGLDSAASHTASELVQLRQTEPVGILDQDCVHPWNVEAAFHDRGAEHYVGFSGIEGHHGALQFSLRHLAVRNEQLETRQHLPQSSGNVFDAFHPRHHIKHLTSTVQFLTDGAAHRFRIQSSEVSFDRSTQGGRRGDQAHLPHTRQTHVERAWNRCRGKGQYIDVLAQHLDLFLLVHAKALLFIHNQESKLLKSSPFAEQLMGSHHGIDRALLEAFKNGFAL